MSEIAFGEEKIKTREDKRMVNHDLIWLFFKTAFFGHILKKISTFTFWCMVIPLGPHSIYTMRSPNLCKLIFTKKSDHERWTMKSDHGKRPSSLVQPHGPWCKTGSYEHFEGQLQVYYIPILHMHLGLVYSTLNNPIIEDHNNFLEPMLIIITRINVGHIEPTLNF